MQKKKLTNLIALFSLVAISPVFSKDEAPKKVVNVSVNTQTSTVKDSDQTADSDNNSNDELELPSIEQGLTHGAPVLAGLCLGGCSDSKYLAPRALATGLAIGVGKTVYNEWYNQDELRAEVTERITEELDAQWKALGEGTSVKTPSKRLFEAVKNKDLKNFDRKKEIKLLVDEHFKFLPRTFRCLKTIGIATAETVVAGISAVAGKSWYQGKFKETFRTLHTNNWNELKNLFSKPSWAQTKAVFLGGLAAATAAAKTKATAERTATATAKAFKSEKPLSLSDVAKLEEEISKKENELKTLNSKITNNDRTTNRQVADERDALVAKIEKLQEKKKTTRQAVLNSVKSYTNLEKDAENDKQTYQDKIEKLDVERRHLDVEQKIIKESLWNEKNKDKKKALKAKSTALTKKINNIIAKIETMKEMKDWSAEENNARQEIINERNSKLDDDFKKFSILKEIISSINNLKSEFTTKLSLELTNTSDLDEKKIIQDKIAEIKDYKLNIIDAEDEFIQAKVFRKLNNIANPQENEYEYYESDYESNTEVY